MATELDKQIEEMGVAAQPIPDNMALETLMRETKELADRIQEEELIAQMKAEETLSEEQKKMLAQFVENTNLLTDCAKAAVFLENSAIVRVETENLTLPDRESKEPEPIPQKIYSIMETPEQYAQLTAAVTNGNDEKFSEQLLQFFGDNEGGLSELLEDSKAVRESVLLSDAYKDAMTQATDDKAFTVGDARSAIEECNVLMTEHGIDKDAPMEEIIEGTRRAVEAREPSRELTEEEIQKNQRVEAVELGDGTVKIDTKGQSLTSDKVEEAERIVGDDLDTANGVMTTATQQQQDEEEEEQEQEGIDLD